MCLNTLVCSNDMKISDLFEGGIGYCLMEKDNGVCLKPGVTVLFGKLSPSK